MADRDDDDEKNESGTSLTPEQRIAKLEKGRLISLVLIIALCVLSIVQMAGLGIVLLQPADTTAQENSVQLAELDAKYLELQKAKANYEKVLLQSQILESKLDKVLRSANIENYASMRELLIDQEDSHLAFLKALKEGMRQLSGMVRGSRTWYEVYREELDQVITATEARRTKLVNLDPGN